jgi:hypothetical protein
VIAAVTRAFYLLRSSVTDALKEPLSFCVWFVSQRTNSEVSSVSNWRTDNKTLIRVHRHSSCVTAKTQAHRACLLFESGKGALASRSRTGLRAYTEVRFTALYRIDVIQFQQLMQRLIRSTMASHSTQNTLFRKGDNCQEQPTAVSRCPRISLLVI